MHKLAPTLFILAALVFSGCSLSKSDAPVVNTPPANTTAQTSKPASTSAPKEAKTVATPARNTVDIRGITTGSDVNVRDFPGTKSNVITMLDKNCEVKVLGFLKTRGKYSWYKIETPNGKIGFIADSFFKPDVALNRPWENKIDGNLLWNKFLDAIANVEPNVPDRSRFRDGMTYYGLNYMTYYNYVTNGNHYNVIFDMNGNVAGLVVSHYQSKPDRHSYYWHDGTRLLKVNKTTLSNNLTTDFSPLIF